MHTSQSSSIHCDCNNTPKVSHMSWNPSDRESTLKVLDSRGSHLTKLLWAQHIKQLLRGPAHAVAAPDIRAEGLQGVQGAPGSAHEAHEQAHSSWSQSIRGQPWHVLPFACTAEE